MKKFKSAALLIIAVLLMSGCGSTAGQSDFIPAVTESASASAGQGNDSTENEPEVSPIPAITRSAVTESEIDDEITAGPEISTETKTAETDSENTALHPSDYAYGDSAMTYLRYINDNFPYRVTGNPDYSSAARDSCGSWIRQTMESFGYETTVYDWVHQKDENDTGVRLVSYAFRKPGASGKRIVIGAHYDCRETHGCEDNGTGVALLLELAERFSSLDTSLSLEFCFWDGEELRGEAGSYSYIGLCPDLEDVFIYINLDCVGSGDNMYVYGGDYEDGVLVRDWGYNMAMTIAKSYGIVLNTIPDVLEDSRFDPPVRTVGSDQLYFNKAGIPYVYFEANAWINEEGTEQHPNGEMAYQYNTNDPQFKDTEGQINHMYCDDLDILEERLPGRIKSHISQFSMIITKMLNRINEDTPYLYD